MEKDFNSDYLRGHIDTIILKALIDGEKYGYEICKDIETKSNGNFVLKQPSLYSALKRLEGLGLISSRWQDSEIGGKRHYYCLTDLGIQRYEESKKDWDYSSSILKSLISDSNDKENSNQNTTVVNSPIDKDVELIDNLKDKINHETQVNFFNEDLEDNIKEDENFVNISQIEPIKEFKEIKMEEKVEKNDAVFINDTYIEDENDVGFSNNVYLRVKNAIKPSSSSGEVNFIENKNKTKNLNANKNLNKQPLDYSIKPYNKISKGYKNSEYININKLNLIINFIIFFVLSFETLSFYLLLKANGNLLSPTRYVLISCFIVFILIFLINLIIYFAHPHKKDLIRKPRKYLTKSIIFASLSFLTILTNLLFNPLCFKSIISYTTMLYPIIVFTNIILQELMFNLLKNNKNFK